MKTTTHFKSTIKAYLDKRAEEDELFAKSYGKEDKNIDGCINYILGQVKSSGCNGFTDDEIFSMAVHYYDEDNIKSGKSVNAKVIVNHSIDLSQEEKEEARKKALEKYQKDIIADMKTKTKRKSKKGGADLQQPSLFEL